jgi:Flp pilus assembly protein TadG
MKILAKFMKYESGQVLIVVALMLVGILAVSVLIIDVGGMNLTKTQLQSAADAAALAGARDLPDNPTLARSDAAAYAAANGIPTGTATITIASDNKSISVAASRTSPTVFAKIFGKSTRIVSADATATVGIAASVPWIVPFAISRPAQFNYDNVYVLRMYGAGSLQDYPSTTNPGYPNNYKYPYSYTSKSLYATYGLNNRYPYQFDYMNVYIVKSYDSHGNPIFNNYGPDYEEYLRNGYHETFSIDQTMYYYAPSTGSQTAVDIFASRVTRDPNTDYTQAKVGDPRVILIPIVDSMLRRNTNTDGSVHLTIIGFVGFFIQDVYKSYKSTSPSDYCMNVSGTRITTGYGTCFWFEGRFLQDLVVGTGSVTFDPNADFGLRVVRLTE